MNGIFRLRARKSQTWFASESISIWLQGSIVAGLLKIRQTDTDRSLSLPRKDCLESAKSKGMLRQNLLKPEVLPCQWMLPSQYFLYSKGNVPARENDSTRAEHVFHLPCNLYWFWLPYHNCHLAPWTCWQVGCWVTAPYNLTCLPS